MLGDGYQGLQHGPFRPSPPFERFVRSPAAIILAVAVALVALGGGAIQLWRNEWLDGSLTLGTFVAAGLAWGHHRG